MKSYFRISFLRLLASAGCVLLVLIADAGLPIARMYVASALFAALLMYLVSRPKLIDVLAIFLLGPALVALHLWLWLGGVYKPHPVLVLAGLGMAAYLVMLLRWVGGGTEERAAIGQILLPAAILTVMLFCTHNLLNFANELSPKTLDLYLFSFDGSLGLQTSFWMGSMFAQHPWFGNLGNGAYYGILMAMGVSQVLVAQKRPKWIPPYFMLELFFVSSFLGYFLYHVFPAAGPKYAFGTNFPLGGISVEEIRRVFVEPIPLATGFMRNAVPSLHMTWALLMWWNLRNVSRSLAWLSFAYVVLTVIGTLGTGEHYLVDLVIAFPFTLMVQALCVRYRPWTDRRRSYATALGLFGTVAWIVALRSMNKVFWVNPVMPWRTHRRFRGRKLLVPIEDIRLVARLRRVQSARCCYFSLQHFPS